MGRKLILLASSAVVEQFLLLLNCFLSGEPIRVNAGEVLRASQRVKPLTASFRSETEIRVGSRAHTHIYR